MWKGCASLSFLEALLILDSCVDGTARIICIKHNMMPQSKPIPLFIYGLFNDTVSNSEYRVSS
jgi:hypothetical protein